MRLFRSLNAREHTTFIKHLRAEHPEEQFIAGKGGGVQFRWVRRFRNNHWFDACYYAAAAGHLCGVRFDPDERPAARPTGTAAVSFLGTEIKTPDGRPFMITER